jgi:hypothetical protein
MHKDFSLPLTLDEWLITIFTISYRNLWLFGASIYPAALFNYLAGSLIGRNQVLGWMLGFGFCVLSEMTLGKATKWLFTSLMSPRQRKNPMFATMSQGWSAFLASMFLMVITGGVFHLNFSFKAGIFEILAVISLVSMVLILAVGAVVSLGKKFRLF